MPGDVIDADAAGKKPPKLTSEDRDMALVVGDAKARQALANEVVEDIKYARTMRRTMFKWVVRPFAFASATLTFFMTIWIAVVMYIPLDWWGGEKEVPLMVHMGQNGISWPLGVFILGTFFSFAAFGAMAFGILSPSQNKTSGIGGFPAG